MNRRHFFLIAGFILAVGAGVLLGKAIWGSLPGAPKFDAPLIGIASLTSDSYIAAVREAGGIPIVLPKGEEGVEKLDAYLEMVDGLLMPGGADIPPSEWGEEPHPTTEVLSDDRYLFEKELVSRWIEETEKPLLGICLGCQWINVAHGGSLVQDIPSEFEVSHRDRDHLVDLVPDSRLSKILGVTSTQVNSSHHQAVRRLGEGLRVVAKCPDGIIEAIEIELDKAAKHKDMLDILTEFVE